MAVYEHTYKQYQGKLTPEWSRFLIIPRHAYRDVFRSKIFTGFFVLCFVCPLVMAILIYLHYNVNALLIMELRTRDLVSINGEFFRVYLSIQCSLAFLVTVLIGPPLVSRDMSNNALPLYLSRPFSRTEYATGKMSVLVILMSAITWIPGLLLFLFQSYLEGATWFSDNLWIAQAIFVGSWTWILTLALLSMTLSAWVKWRIAASAGLFAIFIIPSVMGVMITELFATRWGNIINISALMQTITDSLFRANNTWDLDISRNLTLPTWSAWMALALICAFCLLLLARRIRAYEVVK
jgi:ABC-2 type transport system permease protein